MKCSVAGVSCLVQGLAPGGRDDCESVTAGFGSTSMFDIISHLAGKTETELQSVMVKAVC